MNQYVNENRTMKNIFHLPVMILPDRGNRKNGEIRNRKVNPERELRKQEEFNMDEIALMLPDSFQII